MGKGRPDDCRLRGSDSRAFDQGAASGWMDREAAEGGTLVVGVDRRQRGEVRVPAP